MVAKHHGPFLTTRDQGFACVAPTHTAHVFGVERRPQCTQRRCRTCTLQLGVVGVAHEAAEVRYYRLPSQRTRWDALVLVIQHERVVVAGIEPGTCLDRGKPEVHKMDEDAGGVWLQKVSGNVDYLVVGGRPSSDTIMCTPHRALWMELTRAERE